MRWPASSALLFLAFLWLPTPAGAKLCGDDVTGHDVPCACGDVVTSDVVLGAGDPVTQDTCPSDGLTVRARGTARTLTVDLAGQHLRGAGHGAGLLVVYGGPGGARVISTGGPATVEGFQDGVVAR